MSTPENSGAIAAAWSSLLTPATVSTTEIITTVVLQQQALNEAITTLTERLRAATAQTTSHQRDVEQYTQRLKNTRVRADAITKSLGTIKTRLVTVHERLSARTAALRTSNNTLRAELTDENRQGQPPVQAAPATAAGKADHVPPSATTSTDGAPASEGAAEIVPQKVENTFADADDTAPVAPVETTVEDVAPTTTAAVSDEAPQPLPETATTSRCDDGNDQASAKTETILGAPGDVAVAADEIAEEFAADRTNEIKPIDSTVVVEVVADAPGPTVDAALEGEGEESKPDTADADEAQGEVVPDDAEAKEDEEEVAGAGNAARGNEKKKRKGNKKR